EGAVVNRSVRHTCRNGDALADRDRRLILAFPGRAGSDDSLNLGLGKGAVEDLDLVNQTLEIEVTAVAGRPIQSEAGSDLILVARRISCWGERRGADQRAIQVDRLGGAVVRDRR